jgi:hypothetical protein
VKKPKAKAKKAKFSSYIFYNSPAFKSRGIFYGGENNEKTAAGGGSGFSWINQDLYPCWGLYHSNQEGDL